MLWPIRHKRYRTETRSQLESFKTKTLHLTYNSEENLSKFGRVLIGVFIIDGSSHGRIYSGMRELQQVMMVHHSSSIHSSSEDQIDHSKYTQPRIGYLFKIHCFSKNAITNLPKTS